MHEFDGKALIFMIFNNDAIKNELSGLLDTSRQARRHHLIFLLKIALAMFLILCFAGFAVGIGFVRGAIDAAPSLDIIDVQPQGYASQIYDADGNLMQTLVMEGSNREEVSFDQLPDDLVNAFIAIEDSRFYEHNGIDLKGILRAAYVGITNGRFSEGASTITQQLIKNNVLQGGYETSMADKLRRKIQEQFLAVKLEDQLDSKETILEYYLKNIDSVYEVKVYEKTCDAVISYTNDKNYIIKKIAQFSYNRIHVPEDILTSSGREMNAYYQDRLVNKDISAYTIQKCSNSI